MSGVAKRLRSRIAGNPGVFITERERDLIANLAEAAETLLLYYAGRDEPILDSLRDALADLKQALPG